MVEAMTLHQLRLAADELAGQAAAAGVPATVTRFGVASPLEGAGSAHCFEVPFLFGIRDNWADAPALEGVGEDTFEQAGAALRSLLLGFVADGTPRTHDGAAVVPFDPADPQVFLADDGAARYLPAERGLLPRR